MGTSFQSIRNPTARPGFKVDRESFGAGMPTGPRECASTVAFASIVVPTNATRPPFTAALSRAWREYVERAMSVSGGKTPQEGRPWAHWKQGRLHPSVWKSWAARLTNGAHYFEPRGRAREDVQVALLQCPRETWLRVFGPPKSVEQPAVPSPPFPVEVWHYDCTDGPIECVGCQLNDLAGQRWITFVRVCYF